MRLLMMTIPYVALAALATCAPAPERSAAKLYAQNCASCHGTGGQGDGPAADELPLAPADLTQIATGNNGVFPTEDVMAKIHGYHGQRVHALMPEFDTVLNSPKVMWMAPSGAEIPTPSALVALAEYIEGLQTN